MTGDHEVEIGTKVRVGGQLGEVVRAESAVSCDPDSNQGFLVPVSLHSSLSAPLSSLRWPR